MTHIICSSMGKELIAQLGPKDKLRKLYYIKKFRMIIKVTHKHGTYHS